MGETLDILGRHALDRSARNNPSPPRPSVDRIRDTVATIPILILVPLLLLPFLSTSAAEAKLSVTGVALRGGTLAVVGTDFAPRTWVQLSWDGSPVGMLKARVGGRGQFSGDVRSRVTRRSAITCVARQPPPRRSQGAATADDLSDSAEPLAVVTINVLDGHRPPAARQPQRLLRRRSPRPRRRLRQQ